MLTYHWSQSIHHDGSPRYVISDGYQLGKTVTLRLRTSIDAPIEQIYIRTNPDGEQHRTPMHEVAADNVCRWWEGTLQLQMLRTNYRFFITTAEDYWWYSAAGITRHTPTDATDFKILAQYHTPSWVQDSVFYQIFPDRFADGDSSNNVVNDEYLCYGRPVVASNWGEIPRGGRTYGGVEFFGGDLQGIVQRLDYLEELGVSAIYLTPIFTSPSNHKYDVADYRQVDVHFGGDEALITLRKALDERKMHLMLDIVPNHCGADHQWFTAAQADPTAPTAEFFTFGKSRNEYESWLGVQSLPKLNYRSERLRKEMYAGEDAIMRYWLRPPFRIDGWRIDVANMLARQGESQLEHKIGRGIRRAVKEEAPEAYLIGENFFDGTAQTQGDELDATMNYSGFCLPLLQWLVSYDPEHVNQVGWRVLQPLNLSTEALSAQWKAFQSAIPWQIARQQFNLLGSHDTPRIQTIVKGQEELAQLAAIVLFAYPGIPSVYYGDEIGLEGGGDPDNRRCMPWDSAQWNGERRALYQKLIYLRRTSPALRQGGIQHLYAEGETLAFLREAPDERLLVIARRRNDGLVALPVQHGGIADQTRLQNILTGEVAVVIDGLLPLDTLPAIGAQIWRVVEE